MLLLKFLILACVPSVLCFRTLEERQPSNDILWHTEQWAYNGFSDGNADGWLGVPYAQAPLGALRFKPPVAFDPNALVTQEVRGAREFGKACVQGVSKILCALNEPCI